MKKVVLKIKDNMAVKIQAKGMHLGMVVVEKRPKVCEFEDKEFKRGGLLQSKQFKHYMETVKVKDLEKLEVGVYTDDKKVGTVAKAANKADMKALEAREKALAEREAALHSYKAELDDASRELDELATELAKKNTDILEREKAPAKK